MAASTQLTPRSHDGRPLGFIGRTRNLPHHLNPRDGWKDTLHGTIDNRIVKGMYDVMMGRIHGQIDRSMEVDGWMDCRAACHVR